MVVQQQNQQVTLQTNKRPILITILCILGFIGVLFGAISSLSLILFSGTFSFGDLVEMPPLWWSITSLIILIPYLIGYIYLWKMRKIGLYILTVTLIIANILSFIVSFGGILSQIISLIVGLIILGLLWSQYKKMR
tara:strand:+ start:661 stop:1068 length:408 start_codon:yes stop_codon:yes gene_type:complete